MARKLGGSARQKKRASAEKKAGSDQTEPVNNPDGQQSWYGVGGVPEWIDRAFEEARDLMDEALAKLTKEGKLPKKRK